MMKILKVATMYALNIKFAQISSTGIVYKLKPRFDRRGFMLYFLTFKISSAEQFKKVHNFDRVDKEGCILPDKYCEIVGLDTPIACAISVFDFPDCSISSLKFLLMISSKLNSIFILY